MNRLSPVAQGTTLRSRVRAAAARPTESDIGTDFAFAGNPPIIQAMGGTGSRMHQTTVRFTADLWSQLEAEARAIGVSAAQYVRDATLARLAHTAGARGEPLYAEENAVPATRPEEARRDALETHSDSDAVRAQARLARDRSEALRSDAARLRSSRPLRPAGSARHA